MKTITIPLIALRSMTVLPNMVIHFDISRTKSIKAVEYAMQENQKILLVTQKNAENNEPTAEDLYEFGTIAVIKQIIKMPNKIIRVLVEGKQRAELLGLEEKDGFMMASTIHCPPDIYIEPLMDKAMVSGLKDMIRQYSAVNPRMSKEIVSKWLDINSAYELLYAIAIDIPTDYRNRQRFLSLHDLNNMYDYIARLLIEEINISQIKLELSQKVKERVDKHQKEYIIREQMSVLKEELGEDEEAEEDEYQKKIDELDAADYVKDKLNKELRRLKSLSHSSSEANVERGYIESLLELPWNIKTKDNNDYSNAKQVLDEDHYGMQDIKKRILETLAVRNVTDKNNAPILCLVGPPGTGKTSIARSVARALNKQYVRICLGGVRDEAEIRGHRKTYVGAMPGRIIDGLKKAKSSNPLMLLDEIDKISSDYKGDTASALLEVLDSEQNNAFIDHYVEIPVDLSDVLFIATANDISKVSKPLLDRMEIIQVNSYTQDEKLHIAKDYLVPKQINKNGLLKKDVNFSDKAIRSIIDGYTREAGVRLLERQIGQVCRKVVTNFYENGVFDETGNRVSETKTVRLTDKNIKDYLGKCKYRPDKANQKAQVGIVRGLAWTSVGGDTLEIEVNTMSGKGNLKLTGNMGDVMKESASIALSYVRSVVSKDKKFDSDYFEKNDIHLHIPEGATPKDGPSAGITMSLAIYSAVTKKPVRADIAMTGEVTLRGRVLPIGGLREKLIAARIAGMKQVLVPKDNESDVLELNEKMPEITAGMEITFVKDMKQVIDIALNN